MMDSYVLFTTIHPAPYMDIIIRSLKNEHNVQVLYKCEIDKYKRWKLYKGENGLFFSNMSFISLFRKICNSRRMELYYVFRNNIIVYIVA